MAKREEQKLLLSEPSSITEDQKGLNDDIELKISDAGGNPSDDAYPSAWYTKSIVNGDPGVFDTYCFLCIGFINLLLYIVAFITLIVLVLLFAIFAVIPSACYAGICGKCFGRCCCKKLSYQVTRFGTVKNWVIMCVRARFGIFWYTVMGIPYMNELFFNWYTSFICKSFAKNMPRIQPLNSKSATNSVSFSALYDESREYIGRVLPRNPEYTKKIKKIAPLDDVVNLFNRNIRGKFVPESNKMNTCLLPYYAQWFVHQLFNTDPNDCTRSNQPIGLNASQLYGSTEETENSLRTFKDGLLKSTLIDGKEFPPIIDNDSKSHFMKGEKIFQMPIPLANMVPGFAAIHLLFFRHHQYVARTLKKYYPKLTDFDIYEKTKIIIMLTIVKVTLLDYVGSLKSSKPKFQFNPSIKATKCWKYCGKPDLQCINTINFEFNILYRWHQFYPDKLKILKESDDINELMDKQKTVEFNDDESDDDCDLLPLPLDENWNSVSNLTQKYGIERLLLSASKQRAGKLTLLNTNEWLAKHIVKRGLQECRTYEFDSLNAYRKKFGFEPYTSFEQITDDPLVLEKLKNVYNNDVNLIEYYPGIFAGNKDFGGIHSPFLAYVGVGFTFSGIYSSRLWETQYINASMESLTPVGLKLINDVKGIKSMAVLHTELTDDAYISFTLK